MAIRNRIATAAVTLSAVAAVLPVASASADTTPLAQGQAAAQAAFNDGIQAGISGFQAGMQAAQSGISQGIAGAQSGISQGIAGAQSGISQGIAGAQAGITATVNAFGNPFQTGTGIGLPGLL